MIGWARSCEAAARKRVFEKFARSASDFASASARFRLVSSRVRLATSGCQTPFWRPVAKLCTIKPRAPARERAPEGAQDRLDHRGIRQLALVRIGVSGAHVRKTPAQRGFDVFGSQQSPRCVEAQQLFDRAPYRHHPRRIAEELQITLVPRDQAQFAVDNAHALR